MMHSVESFLGSRKGPADLKYCAPFFQPPWKVYRERIIRSQGSQEHENANSVHGPNVNTVTNSGPRILGGTHSWLLQLFLQRFSCSKEKQMCHAPRTTACRRLFQRRTDKRCILSNNTAFIFYKTNIVRKDTLNEHGNKQSMNTAEDRWFA